MKYTILINQKQIYDAGLVDKTDLVDWAIIDSIAKFYDSPKSKRLDGHVWINLKNMLSEMPMIKLSSKQALSRRMSKLRDVDLITCIYDDVGRMYVRPTPKCFNCINLDEKPVNSELTGVNSELTGVNDELTGCQSSVNGGVNSELTGCQRGVDFKPTNINQPVVNQPVVTKKSAMKVNDLIIPAELPEGMAQETLAELTTHRVKKNAPFTQQSLFRIIKLIESTARRLNKTPDFIILETIDAGWASFKFEWMERRLNESPKTKPAGMHNGFKDRGDFGIDENGKF